MTWVHVLVVCTQLGCLPDISRRLEGTEEDCYAAAAWAAVAYWAAGFHIDDAKCRRVG